MKKVVCRSCIACFNVLTPHALAKTACQRLSTGALPLGLPLLQVGGISAAVPLPGNQTAYQSSIAIASEGCD
eukprot:649647-Amphidinium_carterae.1